MLTPNPACFSEKPSSVSPFGTQLVIKLVGVEKDDQSVVISLTLAVKNVVGEDSIKDFSASFAKTRESDAHIEYHFRDGTVKVRTIPFLCEGDN
jgi:hypothetical protein